MKITKSGKISFKLPAALRQPLEMAARQRLYFEGDDLDHHAFYLLHEAIISLQENPGQRVRLRTSEFFILFEAATMQYLDEPTQILLRQAVETKAAPKGAANPDLQDILDRLD